MAEVFSGRKISGRKKAGQALEKGLALKTTRCFIVTRPTLGFHDARR